MTALDTVLYEHCFYLVKETKKPKYLDFYELDEKDFQCPEIYLEQTIRYKDKWYFVTTGKTYYRSEVHRDNAPKIYIKHLYQQKEVLK